MKKQKQNCPILELENVSVVRDGGKKKILDRVSLTVPCGENAAILGPNGAGKSSLIKVLTREFYPLAGPKTVCRVWGQDRWNIFELRFRLGVVSNDLQALCSRDISGMETVLSGFFSSIGLHRERITAAKKKKALEIIRFLEIEHLKDRKMSVMSSGEARRFLIARALVHNPQALILDEPANSLDLRAANHFKNAVRKIARAGVSIILVTQSLQDIIPEIKRVVLMEKGRVRADGPKEEILTARNIGRLFKVPVKISKVRGYYHALG